MSRLNKILLYASILGTFASGLFGPLYAIFVKDIGGDVLEAGVAFGVFSVVSGLFIFTVGRSAFFKKHLKLMVVLGFLMLTAGEAGYLFVAKPLHLFLIQIILGLAGGILEPSWDGLFSANLSEERAAQFWSVWAGSRDMATGLAAVIGGAIVAIYSFQILFIIMAAFNVGAFLAALSLLRKSKSWA